MTGCFFLLISELFTNKSAAPRTADLGFSQSDYFIWKKNTTETLKSVLVFVEQGKLIQKWKSSCWEMQSKRHMRKVQQLWGLVRVCVSAASSCSVEGRVLLPMGAKHGSETCLCSRRDFLYDTSARSIDCISPSSPAITPCQLPLKRPAPAHLLPEGCNSKTFLCIRQHHSCSWEMCASNAEIDITDR